LAAKEMTTGFYLHADALGIATFADFSPLRPINQRNGKRSRLLGGPP
jgi:hypothetical protein